MRPSGPKRPHNAPPRPEKIKTFSVAGSCVQSEGVNYLHNYGKTILFGENKQKKLLGKSVTSEIKVKFTREGKKKLLIMNFSPKKKKGKKTSKPIPLSEFANKLKGIFSLSPILMHNMILAKAAIILHQFCSEKIIDDPDLTNFVKTVKITDDSAKPFPSARGAPPSDPRLGMTGEIRTPTVWVHSDAASVAKMPTNVLMSFQDLATTSNPREAVIDGRQTAITDRNTFGILFETCFFIIAVLRKIPPLDAEKLSNRFIDIHNNIFWQYSHLIVGTIRKNTRETYLKKFSKFISRTISAGFFANHVALIQCIKGGKFPTQPIRAYVSERLSNVKPTTLMQDISALNHMFRAFGSPSLYDLDAALPDFIKSIAKTFHKDTTKNAAKPLLMSLILELFDFIESPDYDPPIDIHWTWTLALRTLAWFGPRTKEARSLQICDIWRASKGTPDDHLVLIIRNAKTGTVAKPHQKNFIPRFHECSEHCPVTTFEYFLDGKHKDSKTVFHDSQGKRIKSKEFTKLWRHVFDSFCSHKKIPSPKDYTFYSFRTSLCVYLAVFCDFSYELVSTATRHRGTATTERCYVAKGQHFARRTLASRLSQVNHLDAMKNTVPPDFLNEIM